MRIIGVEQNGEGDKMDRAKDGFLTSTFCDPRSVTQRVLVALTSAALFLSAGCAEDSPSSPTEPVDLRAAESKTFSQFGEDGVIEKIFEIIPPSEKYIVAFGAHDGVTNSNARNLIVNHGWGGLLIEGDPKRAAQLAQVYADNDAVTTMEEWVFPGNIELLFEDAGVPENFDLLVIDIDSNDYYIWRAIHDYRPKVVLIEANPHFPPPQLMVIDFHPMNYWDTNTYEYVGASISSLDRLAKKKGYELLYCMKPMSPNCFFVDAQYAPLFGIEDNSPEAIWPPRMGVNPNAGKIPPAHKYLHWRNLKIEKKFIFDR